MALDVGCNKGYDALAKAAGLAQRAVGRALRHLAGSVSGKWRPNCFPSAIKFGKFASHTPRHFQNVIFVKHDSQSASRVIYRFIFLSSSTVCLFFVFIRQASPWVIGYSFLLFVQKLLDSEIFHFSLLAIFGKFLQFRRSALCSVYLGDFRSEVAPNRTLDEVYFFRDRLNPEEVSPFSHTLAIWISGCWRS